VVVPPVADQIIRTPFPRAVPAIIAITATVW
jgi:hypothetical protein